MKQNIFFRKEKMCMKNLNSWLRRFLFALLLVVLLVNSIYGKVSAVSSAASPSEDSHTKAINQPKVSTIEDPIKASPPLSPVTSPSQASLIEFSDIFCPEGAGNGVFCYKSTSGFFSVDSSLMTYNTDRALQDGGDCSYGSGNYTNVMPPNTGGQTAWIIYDLGEVFNITKLISWDLHIGIWSFDYSEDKNTWYHFGSGTTSWSNEHCGKYLYEFASPTKIRYIRYSVTQRDGVGRDYRIAWFSFLTPTPSRIHDPLLYQSILSTENGDSCLVGPGSDATGCSGDPVNTLTGGFDYDTEDLSIPTVAGALAFKRSYVSSAVAMNLYVPNTDTMLGYGWTHNQDIYLTFSSPEQVWFKAQSANQFLFDHNGDGTYTAHSGVTATLSYDPVSQQYTVVDAASNQYTFNQDGVLLTYEDPNGHPFTYTYDLDNRLIRVSDPSGDRFLDFNYTDGLLSSSSKEL